MRKYTNVTYKQGCAIDSGGPVGIADAAAARHVTRARSLVA